MGHHSEQGEEFVGGCGPVVSLRHLGQVGARREEKFRG